jgi:GNAT superfamily N-acetyltransferase
MKLWAAEDGTCWVVDPSEGLPSLYEAQIEVIFAEAETADIPYLAAAMNMPASHIQQRFADGRRCFLLKAAREIITYGWVTHGLESVGELERQFYFHNDEAYIWQCGTLPPWRGQGGYSALLSHIVQQLISEGIACIWIGAARQNEPSIQGIINAGFRPVVDVIYRRLYRFNLLWVFHDDTAKPAHIDAAYRILVNKHERRWGHLALGYRR